MNSFETDLKRAVISWKFLCGMLLQTAFICVTGFDSDLYRISVPVVCTFPYTAAWLWDYQSGYLKLYLYRTKTASYIFGKILACGISGGLLELFVYLICILMKREDVTRGIGLLVFMSGMMWAVLSAVLAAAANSKYIAYGGSFVVCYLLVIFYQRYTKGWYCLYPPEWVKPEHIWVFGQQGIVILVGTVTLILVFIYYELLRRCMERV